MATEFTMRVRGRFLAPSSACFDECWERLARLMQPGERVIAHAEPERAGDIGREVLLSGEFLEDWERRRLNDRFLLTALLRAEYRWVYRQIVSDWVGREEPPSNEGGPEIQML